MTADAPNIDGFPQGDRSLPRQLSEGDVPEKEGTDPPARRMGLEQEFFLVDRRGALRDLADPFLRSCREVARAEGLDPRCFEAEYAKCLVEITKIGRASCRERV